MTTLTIGGKSSLAGLQPRRILRNSKKLRVSKNCYFTGFGHVSY
jgi:hypothetical protein